jgi:hypothetical protein
LSHLFKDLTRDEGTPQETGSPKKEKSLTLFGKIVSLFGKIGSI